MKDNPTKNFPTIDCCGLDCGLCPSYYTEGASRCPGCCGPDFVNRHPTCSIITCCFYKKKFEICGQCDGFPCSKLRNWDAADSFVSHSKCFINLRQIQGTGLEKFLEQQRERIQFLELALKGFNEGRSKSLYCIASTLLPISYLKESIKITKQKIKDNRVSAADIKTKAQILKSILNEIANDQRIKLKLRKK
jgi:hypothetical protein